MAWFDLQVNGYAGVDFNQDDLQPESLRQACEMLRSHGTTGILAAIISDRPEKMEARIRRVVRLRAMDPFVREIIWGLHIEGPFLNPADGYRGAHPADAICPANVALTDRLLDAGEGLVRLFTLAPEQDSTAEVIRFIKRQGVVVSAGHTNADLDTLKRAIDAGLSMFTHLGNGCPMMMPRHDNILQRALALRADLDLCFIADGIHIPFFVLRNYFDLIGSFEKVIVTTDAMSAAGLGAGRFQIGRWNVEVGADLVVRSPDGSHLLGSALNVSQMIKNLREQLKLQNTDIDKVASSNVLRALGFKHPDELERAPRRRCDALDTR